MYKILGNELSQWNISQVRHSSNTSVTMNWSLAVIQLIMMIARSFFPRLISSDITSMNDVCITVPEIAYSDDFMIVEFDKNCNIINVKSFNQIQTKYLFIHGQSFVAYNSNKRAIRDSPWI